MFVWSGCWHGNKKRHLEVETTRPSFVNTDLVMFLINFLTVFRADLFQCLKLILDWYNVILSGCKEISNALSSRMLSHSAKYFRFSGHLQSFGPLFCFVVSPHRVRIFTCTFFSRPVFPMEFKGITQLRVTCLSPLHRMVTRHHRQIFSERKGTFSQANDIVTKSELISRSRGSLHWALRIIQFPRWWFANVSEQVWERGALQWRAGRGNKKLHQPTRTVRILLIKLLTHAFLIL